MKLDFNTKDLGKYELPDKLSHLEKFKKFSKPIKEGVWGFFINQWNEDGSPNELWWEFRVSQIGSSEIATLTDHDEYSDPVKLFWSKIGMNFPFVNTKFTVCGLTLESKIAELAEYHDGTDDGWVENWHKGNKIRNIQSVPCYAINIDYPHLAASLDYYFPGEQVDPFTGEIVLDKICEIKNVSNFAAEKYKDGLPVRYIIQTQLQMMVLGIPYAEIAHLVGGFDFKILTFDLDVEICQDILEKSYDFWQRVLQARDIYEGYELLDDEGKKEIDLQISPLEPEPSANQAYMEFFKEKYKNSTEDSIRLGTEEEWDMCVEYKTIADTIKELENKKKQLEHKIKSFSAYEEIIDFGDNGRIIHKRKEGARSVFRINIKNYKNE